MLSLIAWLEEAGERLRKMGRCFFETAPILGLGRYILHGYGDDNRLQKKVTERLCYERKDIPMIGWEEWI